MYLGYVRLRHGVLTARNHNGEVFYNRNPEGADGLFTSERQRLKHLRKITDKLTK